MSTGNCFRRLNGTHQFGCTSSKNGNVGVVYYIDPLNVSETVDWLINKGPHKPYMVLLHGTDFSRPIYDQLLASGKVNGFLVRDGSNETTQFPHTPFSPDKKCPSDTSGLYVNDKEYGSCKKNQWNPHGNSLLYEDIDLPIFNLNSEAEFQFIRDKCYKKFNEAINGEPRNYPLCAVEAKDFMYAAKDTATCYRRSNLYLNLNPQKFCDPLGDQNVYATMKAVNSSQAAVKTIIASTRMDSWSMFDRNVVTGFDSPLSGIVTLLAAAEALGKVKASLVEAPIDIMFSFFQGESFDYIGSQRMVYEMERGTFPKPPKSGLHTIGLTDISHYLEVGQLAANFKSNTLFVHTDQRSRKNETIKSQVTMLLNALKNSDTNLTISEPKQQALPPASLQSFLKKLNISGVFLSDYESNFTNRYYHSRFDILNNTLDQPVPSVVTEEEFSVLASPLVEYLTNASSVLAKTLYNLATNQSSQNVTVNQDIVSQLLYCFTRSSNCSLLQTVLPPKSVKGLRDNQVSHVADFYVGTDREATNTISFIVKYILAYFTGDILNVNTTEGDCTNLQKTDPIFNFYWMNGHRNNDNSTNTFSGLCVKSTSNYSEAKSPAFFIDNYDWKSGEYSSWSESSWGNDVGLRVFLVASEQHKTATLSVGVILLLLSLIGVYFINLRADLLFTTMRMP